MPSVPIIGARGYNPISGRLEAAAPVGLFRGGDPTTLKLFRLNLSSGLIIERKREMSGYSVDIEQATLENDFFRKVLFTGENLQLVLMALKPGEDIGMETHPHTDQFIRIEAGEGRAMIGGEAFELHDGSVVVIPAGSEHNVTNTSSTEPLKLYTVYAPPEHPDGTVHRTKAEAEAHHH